MVHRPLTLGIRPSLAAKISACGQDGLSLVGRVTNTEVSIEKGNLTLLNYGSCVGKHV